jgi:hypothetical protein
MLILIPVLQPCGLLLAVSFLGGCASTSRADSIRSAQAPIKPAAVAKAVPKPTRTLATYPYRGRTGSVAIGQTGRLVIAGDCTYLETDHRYLLFWPDKMTRWESKTSLRYHSLVLRHGQTITVRGSSLRNVPNTEWPKPAIAGCDYSFQQIVSGLTTKI